MGNGAYLSPEKVNHLMSFGILYVIVIRARGFCPLHILTSGLAQVGRLHELISRKPTQKTTGETIGRTCVFSSALQVRSRTGSGERGRLGRANGEVGFGLSVTTGRVQLIKYNSGAKPSFRPSADSGTEVLDASSLGGVIGMYSSA